MLIRSDHHQINDSLTRSMSQRRQRSHMPHTYTKTQRETGQHQRRHSPLIQNIFAHKPCYKRRSWKLSPPARLTLSSGACKHCGIVSAGHIRDTIKALRLDGWATTFPNLASTESTRDNFIGALQKLDADDARAKKRAAKYNKA